MTAIGNLPTTVTTAEDVERFVSLDHLEPGDLRIPVGVSGAPERRAKQLTAILLDHLSLTTRVASNSWEGIMLKIKDFLFYFSRERRYMRYFNKLKSKGETPSSYIRRNHDIRLMLILREPSHWGGDWILEDGSTVKTKDLLFGIEDAKFNYKCPPV